MWRPKLLDSTVEKLSEPSRQAIVISITALVIAFAAIMMTRTKGA